VVVEPDKMSAEIYSHDKQLCRSWSLSEGRQRKNSDGLFNFDKRVSGAENGKMPTRDELEQKKHMLEEQLKEIEGKKRKIEGKKRKIEEREEEIKRAKEETQLQLVHGMDQEETAQLQEELEEGRPKKKRR